MADRISWRQHHKKSRKGCLCCKNRHLKCDEQGPPCFNCRVRKLDCSYAFEPIDKQQRKSSEPRPVVALNDRRLELELFHHWATSTYQSLVFHDSNEHLWKVTIPRIALDQDYLLNAILALSSLHLSTTTRTPQSKSHQVSALEYYNHAVTAFQSQPRLPTPENHQALFAYSIINFVFAAALPSCLDPDIDRSSIIGNLSIMFSLLRGTTNIHYITRTWLLDGPFGDYVRSTNDLPTEPLSAHYESVFTTLRSVRDESYDDLFNNTSTPPTSALDAVRTHSTISAAIDDLETCFKLRTQDTMIQCFRWLAVVDESFISSVINLDPLALLITMHWGILLDRLGQDKWWARLTGKALVAEIERLLGGVKPGWVGTVGWVQRDVGLPAVRTGLTS